LRFYFNIIRSFPWHLLFLATVWLSADSAQAAMACYDCHGSRQNQDYRPIDAPFRNITSGGFTGNHRTHLLSSARPTDCVVCHPGSDSYTSSHRDGNINLSDNINASPVTATYRGGVTAIPQTTTPTPGNCVNVNCHFESATPTWGDPPLSYTSCSACHQSPPTDGSHGMKHGLYFGTDQSSCNNCHPDHRQELSHALEAGKRPLTVRFSGLNAQGRYTSGSVGYPTYLPSQNPARSGSCVDLYCHSDGAGRAPRITPRWSGQETTRCYSCHGGRVQDNNQSDCLATGGTWDNGTQLCSPYINMTSNGHSRLVGPQWIRKYPCYYCHYGTMNSDGSLKDLTQHVNGTKNVVLAPQWNILGRAPASYNPSTRVCDNVYCHSDGTSDPDTVKPYAWTDSRAECNACHGHPQGTCSTAGCHDGHVDATGKVWTILTGWPSGDEWKAAIPMFPNEGAGTARANSHTRHTQSDFTCDQCHASTVVNGLCTDCHTNGIPPGSMTEAAHLNAVYHANKTKDVVFSQGGSYNPVTKACSNTACHTGGIDPQWGGSVNSAVICLNCHGTTSADVDSFGFQIYSTQAKINLTEWATTGHGRPNAAGPYPSSGNPAANFPGNPCWYCHDNNVIHNDHANPFRLRLHDQFASRFESECVYCHMTGLDSECISCHINPESLAPQMESATVILKHEGATYTSGCRSAGCHPDDATTHKTGAGFWDAAQKTDVKNQYVMMGVCLKCHDDDTGDKCTACHTAPAGNPLKYSLGFRPFSSIEYRFIKPQKARATSAHFGYKHYRAYQQDGTWKGGKFCWDCHDPHGDGNIFMVQGQVATSTDGTFGIPRSRADVSFTRKQSGLDYARISAPYNGICNVCHAELNAKLSTHFGSDYGDGHNASRACTVCHEHRFTDSHADSQPCNGCHLNKPVPRHSGFGQPRDCTKCHGGTIGMRMDIMGQMKANSHHVQGVTVTNKHCYACHWEATIEGLIDNRYHEGYNYRTYSTVRNAKVDLVVWGEGVRPIWYNTTTAVQFLANRIGTPNERSEVTKLTNTCLSCHSDQNNRSVPFNDCKTPRQYAWDGQSVAARYDQTGTTPWGKYNSTTFASANQKDRLTKSFSAHGNAVGNQGGFDTVNGVDNNIPNIRGGDQNVQCFDCHSSHGSKVVGITSSYVTFNGTRNGGNLKETQAGKGGYAMSYKASANTAPGTVNPYNAGAGQCFDCHLNRNAGTTPWGFQSTFGASEPIRGYFDSLWFGQSDSGFMTRYPFKTLTIKGGHMKASNFLNHTTAAQNKINGLCTPCHDPHGVSPTLGNKQAYAVPLLKGTWMTSPYREDVPITSTTTPPGGNPAPPPTSSIYTDQSTFSGSRISENDDTFAGLCLGCHYKKNLTNGTDHTWKSQDRVHESVKGWKTANVNSQHSYACSKCHTPHTGALPRLMVTNCLDFKHRGRVQSGGQPGSASWLFADYGPAGIDGGNGSFPRGYMQQGVNCHPTGSWPDNSWNGVTPW